MDAGMEERVESMLERYRSWPRHFRLGFERGAAEAPKAEPRTIVVCGMGSSAAAAEHVAAALEERGLAAPLVVVRSHQPPAWLSPSDLVVAVSYSGRTWETLECAKAAASQGARLAVVTAGGELLEMARARGWPAAVVEPGEYGRTSMAYLMGGILGLLSRAPGLEGAVPGVASEMEEGLRSVRVEEARPVGEAIAGADAVFVAACGRLSPAARRWRTELGENTKVTARDDVYPESGHNDVVALQVKPPFRALLLSLRDPADPVCATILDAAEEMYRRAGVEVYQLSLEGPSAAYKLARSAMIAGYASTIAAGLRGVDPHETPNLTLYKEGVKRRLFMGP